MPRFAWNGSGTAEVFYDAFVSFWGQGRFCLAGKGKTNPNGDGGAHHRLPLQGVKARIRRTGFFQMGLFLAAQMLLQPLVMLQRDLLVPAVLSMREK